MWHKIISIASMMHQQSCNSSSLLSRLLHLLGSILGSQLISCGSCAHKLDTDALQGRYYINYKLIVPLHAANSRQTESCQFIDSICRVKRLAAAPIIYHNWFSKNFHKWLSPVKSLLWLPQGSVTHWLSPPFVTACKLQDGKTCSSGRRRPPFLVWFAWLRSGLNLLIKKILTRDFWREEKKVWISSLILHRVRWNLDLNQRSLRCN
jgi:hypothetical protein